MNAGEVINILDHDRHSIGSGFFVSPNGYLLTCYHVLKGADYLRVSNKVFFKFIDSKTIYSATVEAMDEEKDIAILHTDLTPAIYYMVKSSGKKGDQLETLGFPNGSKLGIPSDLILQEYMSMENIFNCQRHTTSLTVSVVLLL